MSTIWSDFLKGTYEWSVLGKRSGPGWSEGSGRAPHTEVDRPNGQAARSASQQQDGAGYFPCFHGSKRLVDIFQTAATSYHVVQIQPTLPIKLKVTRHVNMETVGTHEATANLFLDVEMTGDQLNFLTSRNGTDQSANTPGGQTVKSLLQHFGVANSLERVIDTALTEGLDLLYRVNFGRVNNVCCAKVTSIVELIVQ